MRNHTDSSVIEYNEDGSRTETTTITYFPPSKTEQVIAWSGLGLVTAFAMAPLALLSLEAIKEYRENRKARKSEESD